MSPATLYIIEIFPSIQGESTYAGLPCVFVRLAGCNLRCRWCDTEYSFAGGEPMSEEAVMAAIHRYSIKLVELTGGEPMLQAGALMPLAERLLREDYRVLLETSGERDLAAVPEKVVKIMDVKCPASGEAERFRHSNLATLTPSDQVKFVLADRADYEYARAFVHRERLEQRTPHLLFSPAFRKDAQGERAASQCLLDPQELAEWLLEDRLPVRLSLQIHKFIWDPARRGV